MAKAKIERYNGEPAIVIDGKAFPPMTMLADDSTREYIKKLGDAGMRIFYISSAMRWNRPGNGDIPDGVTKTIDDIKNLIDIIPDAYVVLRLNVSPNTEWINAHPSEQLLFNDGSRERVICTSASIEPVDGMVSFASLEWRKDGENALCDYYKEISESPYFDRVIGYFLCAGGTGEWYYPGEHRLHNSEKGTYADFSEPFRLEYAKYLREKYKTEQELRRVWNRPDATFDLPAIPSLDERKHIFDADRTICESFEKWESVSYTIGGKVDFEAKHETNVGVFLNARDYMHSADFFAAIHTATANTIVHFAKVLKRLNGDLLVGAFYGSYGCCDYYDSGNATGTLTLLESGVIDYLAAPGVYNNREPGGVVAQREMQDSFRIRDMIYICEDDSRTHRSLPLIQREAMALYTVNDSINTLKRDFARDICEDIQAWWFDMGARCHGNEWYNDVDILALFKKQQKIGEFAYSLDRTKKNEIALIYDTESVHMVSDALNKLVLDFYRTSDIHRIGAPVDYYFHDDLSDPRMPDYKLYIMLNTYSLSDSEREAIHKKARKNHAAVLWLYAPGFVNHNAPDVQCIENIEKTVGMKVRIMDKTAFPWFWAEAHPALKYADKYRRYGFIDRVVHSNIWIKATEIPPAYMNPAFYIDDDNVTVLGKYCVDSKTAFAMRDDMGFVSVYCCTPALRSEIIASVAEYAGCHIYSTDQDILYANENFIAVHASTGGTKRIRFKKPCSPYEVYESRYYGRDVDFIEVEMYPGETKMWSLAGEM